MPASLSPTWRGRPSVWLEKAWKNDPAAASQSQRRRGKIACRGRDFPDLYPPKKKRHVGDMTLLYESRVVGDHMPQGRALA
jgi:hypothetical protein